MKIQRTVTKSSIIWGSLAILAVVVYLFGLTLPLLGPDEPRYAQVAREMFERGDWVTPTLGGFHWFEKPALLYWLQITFYHIFGVGEFAARFGSALFGLGTIASLWLLARSLITEKSQNHLRKRVASSPATNLPPAYAVGSDSTAAGLNTFPNYLALIAASSLGILVFSRAASFDIIVTFPMTASLVSFFIFDRSAEGSRTKKYLPLVLFYFFIGMSLIAKGLIGILFPFAIVAFYYVLSRRLPSRIFIFSLVWGLFMTAVVAAIWYLPMYERNGWEFIDVFIIQHHFIRFSSNKYQHPQPFFFFLWVLPLMVFPWTAFFFAAVWRAMRGFFRRRGAASREEREIASAANPLQLFAYSWLLVPLVFFSLSGSKLPGYILPSVPAAIIITSVFVFELVETGKRWRKAVISIFIATLLGVAALLIFAVPKFADADSVKSLISAADARGFAERRVFMVYTLSHNAEFYAAGRLLRDETGKQKTFYRVEDLVPVLGHENANSALALVPVERLALLQRDERIKTEIIEDNTELAIVAISLK